MVTKVPMMCFVNWQRNGCRKEQSMCRHKNALKQKQLFTVRFTVKAMKQPRNQCKHIWACLSAPMMLNCGKRLFCKRFHQVKKLFFVKFKNYIFFLWNNYNKVHKWIETTISRAHRKGAVEVCWFFRIFFQILRI